MKSYWTQPLIAILVIICLCGCKEPQKSKKFIFDSSKEVSGIKYSLKDLSDSLPLNWDDYNYVVLEYKISTAQRFHVGFTTEKGYNELRIISYVPNAWNKLAIPLKFFTQQPGAAIDMAATYNQPRYTGWINLGGARGPMHQVDSIGFRMRKPIGNPTLEIRSVSLSVEDPGDTYLEEKPAIDEFGQSNLVSYPEKITSLEQLEKEWAEEEKDTVSTEVYNYSKFGGYKQVKREATGFFRIEKVNDRWWFVDPEGYLFLSVGVDCIHVGGGLNVRDLEKRSGIYKELPPDDLMRKYSMGRNGKIQYSYGLWNLYRRYGDDFIAKAQERVILRMDKWGLNTIANWSSREIMDMNRKAFILPLSGLKMAPDLMGLADVYDENYEKQVADNLRNFVAPLKDNPWLIGYFVGNEPAWQGQEAYLCELILKGHERPIKVALQNFLKEKGDSSETRREFIINTFQRFVQSTNRVLKGLDPNHLNLGIRFSNVFAMDERILRICGETFDVISFNCYEICPDQKMMDRVMQLTNSPMIIGEYHFGTVDRGLAQSLWQVNSQEQRGVAYRYYTENAYSHPGLIGTGYFQWCDQDMTGRFDGENYNCGFIDVTDRPYKPQVQAISETSKRLFLIHSGELPPYNIQPVDARGHGGIPNVWNQ